jgi:PIF1-like helicase/Helix-turn-helix domain/HRDC domain
MEGIEINPQFEQVLNFVNQTNQSIFLTGKAGTGKTTLLKYIKQNTFKQLAIVAPTGVAAINAGGSTIHSFFQFPFTPFLPSLKDDNEIDYTKNNLPTLKYNSQRLAIFRNLELLVIDEISMVRADLLEQIDITLRQTRKKSQLPFGGVQVILIGDMYQLPPVVQSEEWSLLSRMYQSPFFFESKAIKSNPPVYIELEKIYRQSEETFIGLLNKVRNNNLDQTSLDALNAHYKANISQQDYADNITLTTHNRKADEINARNLEALPNKEFKYKCKVEGIFSDKNYPTEEVLVLKKGTRVMFLKNNTEKNYYNGKIGIVTHLDSDKIKVKCEDDKYEIEVGQEMWTNVTYSVNKSSKHVEEDVLGTFTQYPLRLAWAITIHKSQGLTFDKLIIDAAESFSAGQVYVALSRCRSLQGLTFSSLISQRSLMNDNNIVNFANTKQNTQEINAIYNNSRNSFLRNILIGVFDFTEQLYLRNDLGGMLQLYKTRLNGDGIKWMEALFTSLESINEVAVKFKNQLSSLFNSANDLETDTNTKERISKASNYFQNELKKPLNQLRNCNVVTESKEAAALQRLFENLHLKNELLLTCASGFNFNEFIKQKLKVRYPDYKINVYASAKNVHVNADVKYPQLYRKLLLHRDEICNEEHKPIYLVANNKTLIELTNYLPTQSDQLLQIAGFGKAKADIYGEGFLEIIKEFMAEQNLETNMHAKAPKKAKKNKNDFSLNNLEEGSNEKKPNTKEQTYLLFKQGHKLADIAKQRGFALSTIEGHLTPYIANGDIEIDELLDKQKQEQIQKALKNFDPQTGLNPVKSLLPDDITYSEIRYVLAVKLKNQ